MDHLFADVYTEFLGKFSGQIQRFYEALGDILQSNYGRLVSGVFHEASLRRG